MLCVITENAPKISQQAISTADHDNTILLSSKSPQHSNSCEEFSTYDSSSQPHGQNESAPQKLVNMFKTGDIIIIFSIINLLLP